MMKSKILLLTLFALTSFAPLNVFAQEKENIVLLPIDVSPELTAQKELIGTEIQKSLSDRYTVFFGEIVEEALQAEYSKDDCSAESCVQNVAIKFNGEVVVDASVQIVEADIYFRMKFLNVITGELEAVVQEACASCSFSQLLSFVGAQAASVRPTKSAGLTGLLEQRSQALAEPAPEPQKTAPQNVPIAKVENPRPVRKAEVKSPSYWRWGLGALVLAAGGGGGGGGGGGEDGYGGGGSGDGASTTTQTPFNGAGSEYVDNPNMLGGGHTYITVPSSSNNYRYYGNSF